MVVNTVNHLAAIGPVRMSENNVLDVMFDEYIMEGWASQKGIEWDELWMGHEKVLVWYKVHRH